jgi:hypothetical protein
MILAYATAALNERATSLTRVHITCSGILWDVIA